MEKQLENLLKEYGFTQISSNDNESNSDIYSGVNKENVNILEQLFNNYKSLLIKQIEYIKKESSIAVLCKDGVKLLDNEDKRTINFLTCKDILNPDLFINGEDYYDILIDISGKKLQDRLDEIKNDLIKKFKKLKNNITVNSQEFKDIEKELVNKCSVIVVNDYVDNTAVKFIGYCLPNDFDPEKAKNNSYFAGDSADKINIITSGNGLQFGMCRFEFGRYLDKGAYDSRPFFASRLEGAIVDSVKSGEFKPVIGRKTHDNETLRLPFNGAGMNEKFVFLVAGSRSGKGVLTLCQLGEAIAKGYNTFYIDCKPDMGMSIYNDIAEKAGRETFAVDGFTISESKKINIKVHGKNYYDYAYEKLEEVAPGIIDLLGDNKGLFVNLIGYTRAIGDIVYLTTKQAENNTNPNSPYGKTPCFVVIDEIEQYAKQLQDMFFAGEVPSRGLYGGFVGSLINNGNTPDEIKLYLTSIIRYIRNTWNNFGNLSQSKLGQSLFKIFVICQHTHIDTWCKPVASALSLYANGATFILGNESHQGVGAGKYGCMNFKSHYVNDNSKALDHLGMGKFILRTGSTYEPFKSIFLLNEATRDGTNKPSKYVEDMYGRLTNPAVRRLVNKELFGIDDESEFSSLADKEMINTNIGFKEFTQFLIKKKGHENDIAYYLEKGFNYLKSHGKGYENGLWEKFYDYSYESLGMTRSVDTAFIDKIELTLQGPKYKILLDTRYIKLFKNENRYEINTSQYLEDLKAESSTNNLWGVYETQSNGVAKEKDVPYNINIFDDLLEKRGRYSPKTLLEEKKERIDAEFQLYKEEVEASGKTVSEKEEEKFRADLEEKYREEYNDESLKDNIPEETYTEYIRKITEYARKGYNDVFNSVAKLDVDNNQYYITNTQCEEELRSDSTGLYEIYQSQLASQENRGQKRNKEDAQEQEEYILKYLKAYIKKNKIDKVKESEENEEVENGNEENIVESNDLNENISNSSESHVNNNQSFNNVPKVKEVFDNLDKQVLKEGPVLENVSAPQSMVDVSKVVKIYNEIPANPKVKVKKGKNGKLSVPENDVPGLIITHSVLPSFLKKNETVKSILNQFQNDSIRTIGKLKERYTLDAFRALKKEKIKTKDIREVRFFDNEIIFITGNSSKRIGKEVELGNGIDLSQLWDFDSPGFKGLKNLITLQLTRKFMYKMLKDLNLNQTQAVSQICKYSFKQFKHLDNIVIQGLPVLTRTQYEIQMTKFEDKLKQQENYIKQQEYNTAMDKAMQDTFTTNTKTSSIGKPVTDAKGITFYDDLLEYIATKRRNQIQKKKSKGGFFKSVFKGIKWFFLG